MAIITSATRITHPRNRYEIVSIGDKRLMIRDHKLSISYELLCASASEADSFYNKTQTQIGEWLSGYLLANPVIAQ